jgi:hypothetical protein
MKTAIFSFINLREAEVPVLVRLINVLEKPLPLFVLRKVEEELEDLGSVTVEMFLQVLEETIPFLPDGLLIQVRKPLAAENLRMHANDEHLLIIGTIEDADPPAFGKFSRCPPEKIMFQFAGARLFETEDLTPLRIDSGHDVPYGAVFAGSIYPLKNQQQRIAVGCVVKLLQRAQLADVLLQECFTLRLRLQKGFTTVAAH